MNETQVKLAIQNAHYWEHLLEGGAYYDVDDVVDGLMTALKPVIEEAERKASEDAWKKRDQVGVSHSVRNPYEKHEESILLIVVETSRDRAAQEE